ncbi:SacI homology domain-domain-containing protein, partial [Naematelia encephala]
MPATLYLRPSPRAFFLITLTHALVFRQPDASETKASRSVVVAEFLPIDEVDMRGLVRASKGRTVDGVLGVTSVPTERSPIPEIFLLLLSASSPLPSLLPSSTLRPSRVIAVEFHSLSSAFWDSPELATNASSSSLDLEYEDPYDATGPYPTAGSSTTQSQAASQGVENPCNGMRKYLESGSFFYADGCRWDISSRMGETNWVLADKGIAAHPLETFDERFVWNASLLAPFLAFRSNLPLDIRAELDDQSLLIPVIQGFCGSLPVSTGAWTSDGRPEIAALGLVSRLSWKRAGARFRTRGIDDDGQVANFVETELILATDSVCLSYVQVRGSVPLFWQQPSQGIQTLQQKVELTRPPQATQPAFDKHFLDLLEHYHSVHAINLLGQKDAEAMLSSAYSDHLAQLQATLEKTPPSEKGAMDAAPHGTLSLTPYDFHAAVKTGGHDVVKYDLGTRLSEVIDARERFGWTAVDMSTGQIIQQQQGVFRTNCLDCLDRTNYVQDVISSITLASFLSTLDSPLASSATLWSAHRELWADNGDRLSKIYAGTGAINTSATRSGKKTFAG